MFEPNLALRPNCLLTRSPLIYIPGPRSLLVPQLISQQLQDFILAHGYQMKTLPMPLYSQKQRKYFVRRWLHQYKNQSFHFIMAEETWIELQDQFSDLVVHPYSTMTLIQARPALELAKSRFKNSLLYSFIRPSSHTESNKNTNSSPPLTYRLHQAFCSFLGRRAVPYTQTLLTKDRALHERFLDHCVRIAENEFQEMNSRM